MTNDTRFHARLRRTLFAARALVALLLIGGVLLTWAWNALAVDLAQAPRLQFRHALAFEAAFGALIWLAISAARLALPRSIRCGESAAQR